MKSILELISMMNMDGSSAITDVKIKINQLMGLTEGGFNIGESMSRSGEDGALTDLRTTASLITTDPKTIELRRRLTLLQNKYNLIKFEEKIDEEAKQSTFIITDVVYPEFLHTVMNVQLIEDMNPQEVNSVVIRNMRPENRFTVEKRNNAQYLAPMQFLNDNYQFIVVPKNLSLLQEKLNSLAPTTSFRCN
ncbi:hypothetical protein [Legionella sp. WA2024007413]